MRQISTKPIPKLLAILLVLSAFGCATVVNPVSGKKERTVMDEQAEIAEGQQADQQVRAEYGVYENAALQAYVNEVGQKLAASSQRANLKWTFTLVDSPEINAFALPGGYVYMTRGLMAYLNSESELAGVLGHEIGHVTARHASQRATREAYAGAGATLISILGAVVESHYGVAGAADLAGQTAQTVANTHILSYGRDQELQADKLGADYLARTNQDPNSMTNVLRVLKSNETFRDDEARATGRQPQRMPTYLSTHPSNDQRLQAIAQIASQYTGTYGDTGHNRYLQKINGMTFGDSRAQGLVRGRNFYHEPLGLTLQAPQGWQFHNETQQLLIVSADEEAAVAMQAVNTRGDQSAALNQLAAQLKVENIRTERLNINGLPATSFTGTSQGNTIEAFAVTLKGNDFVLRPLAKSAQGRERYRREMRGIIESFRLMNANDAAAARPYTLRTVAMPRAVAGSAFHTLAQEAVRTADVANAEGQLRLLNQAYPQGEIAAGMLVKTIQ